MEMSTVLTSLEPVVQEWFRLGLELGLPESTLSAIEHDHPNNVNTRKRKMVQKWMHSSHPNPTWCSLMKALKAVGLNSAAEKICKAHCKLGSLNQGPCLTKICCLQECIMFLQFSYPTCVMAKAGKAIRWHDSKLVFKFICSLIYLSCSSYS